jgi:hypothetical protein
VNVVGVAGVRKSTWCSDVDRRADLVGPDRFGNAARWRMRSTATGLRADTGTPSIDAMSAARPT